MAFIIVMIAIVYMKSLKPTDKNGLGQFAVSFGNLMKPTENKGKGVFEQLMRRKSITRRSKLCSFLPHPCNGVRGGKGHHV